MACLGIGSIGIGYGIGPVEICDQSKDLEVYCEQKLSCTGIKVSQIATDLIFAVC